jgi:hypothetical protein
MAVLAQAFCFRPKMRLKTFCICVSLVIHIIIHIHNKILGHRLGVVVNNSLESMYMVG